MTVQTGGNTSTQKSYSLSGIKFERVGQNRIRLVPTNQSQNSPIEFSLKDWNEVCMNLGFHQYLSDTNNVTGGESGSGSSAD